MSQAGNLIAMAYKKNRLYELSCYTDVRQNVKPRTYVSTMNMPKQEKWHRMLGHTSFSNLKLMCEEQLAKGLPKRIENELSSCEVCLRNKMTNLRIIEIQPLIC